MLQDNYRNYYEPDAPGLVEMLLELLSTQEFWIGVAFTISVVGIACLLFGNRRGIKR